jgi:hypothetical protein
MPRAAEVLAVLGVYPRVAMTILQDCQLGNWLADEVLALTSALCPAPLDVRHCGFA